jgi:pyruvate dehydrogenase E1 component subunit beta
MGPIPPPLRIFQAFSISTDHVPLAPRSGRPVRRLDPADPHLARRRSRDAGPVDIARATVHRPGRDPTLVTYGGTLFKTLTAVDSSAREGIEEEVVDMRVLLPLDAETIFASVRKMRRAVIVDEGWRRGSLSAQVSARIIEGAL